MGGKLRISSEVCPRVSTNRRLERAIHTGVNKGIFTTINLAFYSTKKEEVEALLGSLPKETGRVKPLSVKGLKPGVEKGSIPAVHSPGKSTSWGEPKIMLWGE